MTCGAYSVERRSTGPSVATAGAAAADLVGRLGALLDLERVAATARRDGVRIVDREPRRLDRVEVVDLRAAEVRSAERVDDDLDAVHRQLDVALLRAPVEPEPVLEARAAAALDRDPQDADVLLLCEQLLDLGRGTLRDRQERGRRGRQLGDLHASHRSSESPWKQAAKRPSDAPTL